MKKLKTIANITAIGLISSALFGCVIAPPPGAYCRHRGCHRHYRRQVCHTNRRGVTRCHVR